MGFASREQTFEEWVLSGDACTEYIVVEKDTYSPDRVSQWIHTSQVPPEIMEDVASSAIAVIKQYWEDPKLTRLAIKVNPTWNNAKIYPC